MAYILGQEGSCWAQHVAERTAELAALHARTFCQPKPASMCTPARPKSRLRLSDKSLLHMARNAKNGHLFAKLWDGDTKSYASHIGPGQATRQPGFGCTQRP